MKTAIFLFCATFSAAAEIIVNQPAELPQALRGLKAGDVLQIGPGEYPGGHHIAEIEGLTIAALDPKNPPRFIGGANGFHFSRCARLTLRNLDFNGQTSNGLNLDDGGDGKAVTGITLEHLRISDVGPRGNHDGIKCSGLDQLTIRGCEITGWGGQGIDCVGCHHVLITGCKFTGKEGFSATAGVQFKGGSSDVVVEKCHFKNGGERPLNLGGSTGLEYFRPLGAKYEAARLIARENVIEGSSCAAAFVGVDGAEFSGNTVLFPQRWIFRLLQETTAEGFIPSRNVLVKENRVVFRRADIREFVNIGGGTAPETFRFEKNTWFAEDRPADSRPRLPVPEKDGVHGTDPR